MAAPHDHSHSTHDPDHDHGHDHGHDHVGEGPPLKQGAVAIDLSLDENPDPQADGHAHDHASSRGFSHSHSHAPADTGDWRYAVGLIVNLAFVIIEFGAGFIADSTALMADAGHNLSDVLGLALAGGAAWLVRRGRHGAAGRQRTYGYGKATVLAALANALLLIFACGAIAFEAIRRLAEPAPVASTLIIAVAGIGFIINLGTALMFMKDQHKDLNVRGAYLHMMADAGVSLGVVIAGLIIMFTGWSIVDALVSLAIVAVIMISTWGLLKDSVNLALDAAPRGADVEKIQTAFMALPGVKAVHDLHVWGLSTTETALTAHIVHERDDAAALLAEAQGLARRRFGIGHTTIQLENEALPDCPTC